MTLKKFFALSNKLSQVGKSIVWLGSTAMVTSAVTSRARSKRHRVALSKGSLNFFKTPATKKHACSARVAGTSDDDDNDVEKEEESGEVTEYRINDDRTMLVAEGGGILRRESAATNCSRQATMASCAAKEEDSCFPPPPPPPEMFESVSLFRAEMRGTSNGKHKSSVVSRVDCLL